jgi:hypothetical protein
MLYVAVVAHVVAVWVEYDITEKINAEEFKSKSPLLILFYNAVPWIKPWGGGFRIHLRHYFFWYVPWGN